MDAKELRRGNLIITDDYSDTVFSVKDIVGEVITCNGGKNGTWTNLADLWNPIPLTEEWLMELGFRYSNQYLEWRLGDCNVWISYDFILSVTGSVGYENTDVEIKKVEFVHQVQNFYGALGIQIGK